MSYENETEVSSVLQSVITVTGHIKNGARVKLYADCEGFTTPIKAGWLEKWAKNGWRTSKGKPIKDGEKWLKAAYCFTHLGFQLTEDDNGYKNYMNQQLKRRETA